VHYDLFDVVVTVLAGRKRFQFFPQACRRRLKPYRSPLPCCNYSSRTDREVRDLFERTADPRVFDLTADVGEMVYIPSCWWHRVTNDGFTASLSSLGRHRPPGAIAGRICA
jgi:ribosomal protein L16 Arg81 hydroxylase